MYGVADGTAAEINELKARVKELESRSRLLLEALESNHKLTQSMFEYSNLLSKFLLKLK